MTMSSAMTPPTMVVMMVAMMLPSIALTLWRHHRHHRVMRAASVGQQTTLFALGYASVWAAIGLAMFEMSAKLCPMQMPSPTEPLFPPWLSGAVILCAGTLQRSRWKARQLQRCRESCVAADAGPRKFMTPWRDGYLLGINCVLSCAAPMAVLFVAGLMDARMMAVITAAVTAERVAPTGNRIARLTGAVALVAGLVICLRAIGSTMNAV